MNVKANALEAVQLSASMYYSTQAALERDGVHLVNAIKAAKEAGATQQAIADACVVEDRRLSRQRIAQLLST